MALARNTAIMAALVIATMTSSCRSPPKKRHPTLAAAFKGDRWRLVAARQSSPVVFPDRDVIASYDPNTRELSTQGFGNYYGMVATETPDGDFTWGAVMATAMATTPELEAAGTRYTELVSKTQHVSTGAASVALESNDGTIALEYRRVVHP